jgi:hypothetical protein
LAGISPPIAFLRGVENVMRFLIQRGYYSFKDGWHENENGSIYAVIPVDSDLKQIGDGDVSLDLDGIGEAIKRINGRKEVQ